MLRVNAETKHWNARLKDLKFVARCFAHTIAISHQLSASAHQWAGLTGHTTTKPDAPILRDEPTEVKNDEI